MKTYSAKPQDVKREWYLVDASSANLGRLSTIIARLLTGKNKPMYTPHIDCGDYVVVTNTDNIKVTGDKNQKKIYYRHTGYPGGIKETDLQTMLEKNSTEVITKAVRGMLPNNKLRAERLKRLKVYPSQEHNHNAQNPQAVNMERAK